MSEDQITVSDIQDAVDRALSAELSFADGPLGLFAEPRLAAAAPAVSFARHDVQPPAGLYLSPEDVLVFTVHNSAPGVRLALVGRFLKPDGETQAVSHPLVPTTDRSPSVTTITLGEGFLLTLGVTVLAGAPLRGQTYCRVQVARGRTGSERFMTDLLADYVSTRYAPVWPVSQARPPTQGQGLFRLVTGSAPNIGQEIFITVPAGVRWRPYGIRFTLQTGGELATRVVSLKIDDGLVTTVTVAGGARTGGDRLLSFNFARQVGLVAPLAVVGEIIMPLPDLLLLGTWRIFTKTENIRAFDQYSAPVLLVEEWIEG